MIVFVSGGTAAVRAANDPRIGQLLVPRSGNVPTPGQAWAADNDAFHDFHADRYLRMLDRIHLRQYRSPAFVSVPDVVGDARATRRTFEAWYPRLRPYRLPLAYVLQDGQDRYAIPWDRIAAVFVGGTTEFKLSAAAANFVGLAKAFGKWAHMGRVNSRMRLRYAAAIGCDSIDGTTFSKWSNVYVPKAVQWLDEWEQESGRSGGGTS